MRANQVQGFAIPTVYVPELCVANRHGFLQHGGEDRLKIAGRPPKRSRLLCMRSRFKEPQPVATGWGVLLLSKIRCYNKKRPRS